jgi:hypothetical protein
MSNIRRPTSVYTEFMETDWEMDDEKHDEVEVVRFGLNNRVEESVVSEFEEDDYLEDENSGQNSPRASLDSVRNFSCHKGNADLS